MFKSSAIMSPLVTHPSPRFAHFAKRKPSIGCSHPKTVYWMSGGIGGVLLGLRFVGIWARDARIVRWSKANSAIPVRGEGDISPCDGHGRTWSWPAVHDERRDDDEWPKG